MIHLVLVGGQEGQWESFDFLKLFITVYWKFAGKTDLNEQDVHVQVIVVNHKCGTGLWAVKMLCGAMV